MGRREYDIITHRCYLHPTFQMRPSYHPEGLSDDSDVVPQSITQTWHRNGTCPPNSIPIRRTTEEDVLRASSIKRFGKKAPRSIPSYFSVDDPNTRNMAIGHKVQNLFKNLIFTVISLKLLVNFICPPIFCSTL
jgi:hypothetical protein